MRDREHPVPSRGCFSPHQGMNAWNRDSYSPQPTSGTIVGVPEIQTPSRAEHGPNVPAL
jgi:hypothetical protein